MFCFKRSDWLFQKLYFGRLKGTKRDGNPEQLGKKELKTFFFMYTWKKSSTGDEDFNHSILDSMISPIKKIIYGKIPLMTQSKLFVQAFKFPKTFKRLKDQII